MKGLELWHNHSDTWLKSVDIDPEKLASNQVVVKSLRSLVSTGTEKLVLTDSLDQRTSKEMSLPCMKGEFSSDFTYGYSLVGEVIGGKEILVGQFVHLLHPHQSYAIIEESYLFFLPKELTNSAVLLSNLETVINAIWDSRVGTGDNVLIIGYGIIGSLLSRVIQQIPGVSVKIHELNTKRKNHASKYHRILNDTSEKFDIAFNTSGAESGMQLGIEQLRKEGTLVEMSWYGGKKVSLALGGSFHYDRKKIISSQVGSIPSHKSAKWNYKSRKELALQLLKEIDFSDLLIKEIPFEETPSFYSSLRKNEIDEIGIVINY